MKRHTPRAAAIAVSIASCAFLAIQAEAGPDKVKFPDGFDQGVLYATVDRADVKQVRDLYATPGMIKAAKDGQPLPSGAVIAMKI